MSEPRGSDGQVPHVPVLLAEVLEALAPARWCAHPRWHLRGRGYSRALLEAGAAVIAVDRDPSALPHAERLSADFPSRFSFVAGTFSELDELAGGPVDGVVLDIGVSSMQLDQAERGFSLHAGRPARYAHVLGGRERSRPRQRSRRDDAGQSCCLLLARSASRAASPIPSLPPAPPRRSPRPTQLARLIEKAIGRKPGDAHPATRSFQALRIAVNGEFDQLVEGLFASERLLRRRRSTRGRHFPFCSRIAS